MLYLFQPVYQAKLIGARINFTKLGFILFIITKDQPVKYLSLLFSILYIILVQIMSKKQKIQPKVHVLTNKAILRFTPALYSQPQLFSNVTPLLKSTLYRKKQQTSKETATWISQIKSLWQKLSIMPNNKISTVFKKSENTISAQLKQKSSKNNLLDNQINQVIQKKQQNGNKKRKGQSMIQNKSSDEVQTIDQRNQQNTYEDSRLKFVLRFAFQYFLVGNSYQLDLIRVSNINSKNDLQTEYMWSFKYKTKITHVCLEQRKFNLLVIVTDNVANIYVYDPKKVPNQPLSPIKSLVLQQSPKYVEIVRQSNVCFFFQQHLQVFIGRHTWRRRYNDKYQLPQHTNYKLFYIPPSFENYVSVFFQQKKDGQARVFCLWQIQFEFGLSEIKARPIQKIYEIKESLKKLIKLTNYSKQIFLLNLGSQILALKRGYILDSAQVDRRKEQSKLQYTGNDTLLHINSKTIQVYSFYINLNAKPFKIVVQPRDSIKINNLDKNQQFYKAVPIFEGDYIFLYQKKKGMNKLKNGELHYSLYITRGLTREQKILQIFPKTIKQYNIKDEQFLDKKDMAEKMGYTSKQIYLQLWNRSRQSTEDWNLLTNTSDYPTINSQILKKLKKTSINYTQIESLQKTCFKMLKQKLFSHYCTQQIVMDYINCHFFIKKLRVFLSTQQYVRKKLKLIQNEDKKKELIKLTIKDYNFYRNMSIKQQLLTYVQQFNYQNSMEIASKIRFLLQEFKFIFRLIYQQILQQIIKIAKDKLVEFLKAIPQILPYKIPIDEQTNQVAITFSSGVWQQITNQQWKQNLYLDTVSTVDNKQIIQQVIKSINFKRNWLSYHGMFKYSVQSIKSIEQKISSQHIFYFFIAKLFQYVDDYQILKNIVNFLEVQYSAEPIECQRKSNRSIRSIRSIRSNKQRNTIKHLHKIKMTEFPQNIRGKVFLYKQIYTFLEQNNIIPYKNGQPKSLSQFLQLNDPLLIKHCFDKQRSIKGLLLRDIKGIYERVLQNNQYQMFNKALLNYFISNLSTVSDLKYLLNRINNQKQQFHRQNAKLYPVLIQALQRKMKIGTQKDIPLNQVLIYLQNIPLYCSYPSQITQFGLQNIETAQKKFLHELNSIQKLNLHTKTLKQAKINMTVYDILRKQKEVFTKLIEYELESCNAQILQDINTFKQFSIKVIVEIEQISKDVYGSFNYQIYNEIDDASDIFFIYLGKICEKEERIHLAKKLLNMQQFVNRYSNFNIQGLVQSMYIWKMTNQKSYIKNQNYIHQLLSLIPQDSNTYQSIYNQLQYVKLLHHNQIQISYPICENIIKYEDLQQHINRLPIEFINTINIITLYEVIKNIEIVKIYEFQHKQCQEFIAQESLLKQSHIYQIFIMKFMKQKELKEVLRYIHKFLYLEKDIKAKQYDIVFVILYILQIIQQLNQHNKETLVEIVWYYFNCPKDLLDIVEYIILTELTQRQMKAYLDNKLQIARKTYKRYNPNNPILNKIYLQQIFKDQKLQYKFDELINDTNKKLKSYKEQFKHLRYSVIMAMLCHNPYIIAKYIYCQNQTNLKPIKSLLSFASLEDIFQTFLFLEVCRRIFLALLQSLRKQIHVEDIIADFQQFGLDEWDQISLYDYQPLGQQNQLEMIYISSIQNFHRKKEQLRNDLATTNKYLKNYNKTVQQRIQLIQKTLCDKMQQERQIHASYYIFSDSDNEEQIYHKLSANKMVRAFRKKTEVNNPLAKLININLKKTPMKLYASSYGQKGLRKSNRLCLSSRRQSNKILVPNPKSTQLLQNKSQISSKSNSYMGHIQFPQLHRHKSHQQYTQNRQWPGFYNDNNPNMAISLSNVQMLPQYKLSPQICQDYVDELSGSEIEKSEQFGNSQIKDNENKICQYMKIIVHADPNYNDNSNYEYDDKLNTDKMQKSTQNYHGTAKPYKIYQQIYPQQYLGKSQPYNSILTNRSNSFQQDKNQFPDLSIKSKDSKSEQQESYNNNQRILQDFYSSVQYKQNKENNIPTIQQMTNRLIEYNIGINLLQSKHNLDILQPFQHDKQYLVHLIGNLYTSNIKKPNIHIVLCLILQICQKYPITCINSDVFKYILKIQQAQCKTIPQISLSLILSQSLICKKYQDVYQLFLDIYQNIYPHIGSQNIYTLLLFIRRVFDNVQYQEQIIWDFVLDLCEKIDKHTEEQKEWNIQKICATLPKINIHLWNRQFNKFVAKVLSQKCKDQLILIFCKVIKTKMSKEDNRQEATFFLNQIKNIYNNKTIRETLQILNKQ